MRTALKIAAGVLGGGKAPVVYLLRDEFATDLAAGSVDGTSAEPGPGTRKVIDTESKLSISTDRMYISGGKSSPAYGDPSLWYPAIPRAEGYAIINSVNMTDDTKTIRALAFSTAQSGGGTYYIGLGNTVIGTEQMAVGSFAGSTTYELALVQRGVGMIYLIKGGAFTTWTVLWVSNTGNDASLYPGIANYYGVADFGFIRGSQLPSPWNVSGGIATQILSGARAEGDTFSHETSAMLYFTVTTLPSSGSIDFRFRIQDADNYWQVAIAADGSCALNQVTAGTPTARRTGTGVVNGNRIAIRLTASNISVWNKYTVIGGDAYTTTALNTLTAGALVSLGTGGAVTTIEAWPRILSGAALNTLTAINSDTRPNYIDINSSYATNASAALTIPTYDGSGHALHPAVIDAGAGGWNGKRYWMVMTPLPGNDSDYENPSVLCSDDGNAWSVPTGLTNPVVAKPAGSAFNTDPELILIDGVLWMVYRETMTDTYDRLYAISSTDGVSWSDPELILDAAFTSAISPALVDDGGTIVMFTTNASSGYAIERRTAETVNGVYSAAASVLTSAAAGINVWHGDVIKQTNGNYLMAVSQYGIGGIIKLAESLDQGVTWRVSNMSLISKAASPAWDQVLYRPSMVEVSPGYVDVWYSAYVASPFVPGIGRTAIASIFD